MQMHNGPAIVLYQSLLRLPTKNPARAVTLSSIFENSENNLDNEKRFVDVIVVVTDVSYHYYFLNNII